MAEKYHGWCRNLPIAYRQSETADYCIFHAPKEHGNIIAENFNKEVFNHIQDATDSNKKCNLSGVIFPGPITFSQFNADNPLPEIDFSNTTFREEANFQGTTFSAYTCFSRATFNGTADFSSTDFRDKAIFAIATFNGFADFYHSTFCNKADFFEASFNEKARFIRTNFSSVADFYRASFKGETEFITTTFNDRAVFSKAVFSKALFKNLILTNCVSLSFLDVTIYEKIKFEIVDLTKSRFLDTDIRKMDFISCDWNKKQLWLGLAHKKIIRDELDLYKDDQSRIFFNRVSDKLKLNDIEKVEILYRRLKQKYKDEHDQIETSEWHYREKEMFRKKKFWRRYFGISFCYWLFSGYGEKPGQAGVMLFVLFGGIMALMNWISLTYTGGSTPINIIGFSKTPDWTKFELLAEGILKHALFFKSPPFHSKGWGEIVLILATRVFIPVQTALFIFALRNKFRR